MTNIYSQYVRHKISHIPLSIFKKNKFYKKNVMKWFDDAVKAAQFC